MTPETIQSLDWGKQNGLLPAVVQDAATLRVLMLGYMTREALEVTLQTRQVTFHSRSKARLWTKGEGSGNRLDLVHIEADCDRDTLLVLATPHGPTCHLGRSSCFASAPGDYLAQWRMALAGQQLARGEPLKAVAQALGYSSPSALSRAFSARVGAPPRAWLRQAQDEKDS